MSEIKELLECDDIQNNRRVQLAYAGLLNHDLSHSSGGVGCCTLCGKERVGICEPRLKINLPIEIIAFRVRDACITMDIDPEKPAVNWNKQLMNVTGNNDTYNIMLSDSRHWIIAATLCYEEMKGGGRMKHVLDACCGSRMFWYDKSDERCLFVDIRRETHTCDTRPGRKDTVINPDRMADFTDLPFEDDYFYHIVFDPPHTLNMSETTRTVKKYGTLKDDWQEMLSKGFSECFRVLRPGGTLIFKWSDIHIPLSKLLSLTPEKPLYGHKSGKQQGTHWVAFIKETNK